MQIIDQIGSNAIGTSTSIQAISNQLCTMFQEVHHINMIDMLEYASGAISKVDSTFLFLSWLLFSSKIKLLIFVVENI